jgi:hypothetical protein
MFLKKGSKQTTPTLHNGIVSFRSQSVSLFLATRHRKVYSVPEQIA